MYFANPFVDDERDRFDPVVALHESPTSYVIQIDLPDCAAKDVDVRVHGRDIVIHCSRAIDRCSDVHREFGSFLKRVRLERAIDAERVRTSLRDGTLNITAQKIGG